MARLTKYLSVHRGSRSHTTPAMLTNWTRPRPAEGIAGACSVMTGSRSGAPRRPRSRCDHYSEHHQDAAGGGPWLTDASMSAVGTALAGVASVARQEVGELAVHLGIARQAAMAAPNLDVSRGCVPRHGVGVAYDRIASAVDGGEADTVRQPAPRHGERRAEGNDVAGRGGPAARRGGGADAAPAAVEVA